MRERLQAWANLPLSLIGWINLFEIRLLPAFLYVLQHSPVWISRKVFRLINSNLLSFVWGRRRSCFRLTVLEALACPDLHKYYLAAQLTHAHNWLVSDESNVAVMLEAACPFI